MKVKGAIIFKAAIASAVIIFSAIAASAQGIMVIGEARMTGKSFLKSADERWLPAPTTYPVVQDTSIRTGEGSAAVYFKDGSRVSFPRDSEGVISGSPYQYSIDLVRGRIAFNIAAGASLSVGAGSASIIIDNNKKIVRKVSYETPEHMRGVVTLGKNGLEVRSIAGMVSVGINSSIVRDLKAGEAILINRDNTYRVITVQAVEETEHEGQRKAAAAVIPGSSSPGPVLSSSGAGLAQAGILLGFSGGLAYAIKEGFSGSSGFASPSSPGAQRIK